MRDRGSANGGNWYDRNTSTTTAEMSASTILASVITPSDPTLHPAVASEFLKRGFTPQDRERMAQLAAKARAGSLTDEEKIETKEYEQVSSFLGLVKSKARRSLQNHSSECIYYPAFRPQITGQCVPPICPSYA